MTAREAVALVVAVVLAVAGLRLAAGALPFPLLLLALPALSVGVVAVHAVVAHGWTATRGLGRRRPPR